METPHDLRYYNWAIGLNRLSLNIIGVWPDPDTPLNHFSFLKYIHVPIVALLIIFGSLLPQAYGLLLVFNEIPLFLDNVSQTVPVAFSSSKLLLLWLHQKSLRIIMGSIKLDWLKLRDNWEKEIMLDQAKSSRTVTKYGMTIMTLSFIGLIMGPIFGVSYRTINNITDASDRFLPLQSYYPFDISKSPFFEISYLFQAIGIGLTCLCFSSPVSLFSVIVFHSCGQLKILATKIENMKYLLPAKKTNNSLIFAKTEFRNHVKEIVKEHVRIMRIVNIIEDSFKGIVFAQVVSVSVATTCMGVQFVSALESTGRTPPVQQMITLAGPILTGMLITFVYCFTGETLIEHYTALNKCVYKMDWYSIPRRNATDLLFIMSHTENPLRLTAGKFIFLSLESFCSILKTSGGYFSMLIAVRDK